VTLWSEPDLDVLHETTLQILAETGVRVDSVGAQEAMVGAGCRMDARGRICVPADAVRRALASCPKGFTLAARDRQRSLQVDAAARRTYVHNMSGAAAVCDPLTGERRAATCADQVRLTRVMHHLTHQHLVCPMLQLQDVPEALEPLYSYIITAWETDKYVSGPGIETALQAKYLCEMSRYVAQAGEQGALTTDLYACLVSPLQLPAVAAEVLLAVADLDRILVTIIAAPVAGTTAPVTLSAAIAQENAELLAGVVCLQAVAPGTPTMVGPRLSAADLRSGLLASGRYATGLAAVAIVELARRYGLPCDCYGLCTDSMVADAQFGYERALNGLLGMAARPSLLSGIGDMQSGMATCPEALLIDDDILGDLLAASEDDSTDGQALDAQVVADGVASASGFLGLEHTRRHSRNLPEGGRLVYAGGVDRWRREGWSGMADRARGAVAELLAREPVGLPGGVFEELCRLIERAAGEMGVERCPDPRAVVSPSCD
jgi:trimethylamine--corrinoid protein Co-methyltransferase